MLCWLLECFSPLSAFLGNACSFLRSKLKLRHSSGSFHNWFHWCISFLPSTYISVHIYWHDYFIYTSGEPQWAASVACASYVVGVL